MSDVTTELLQCMGNKVEVLLEAIRKDPHLEQQIAFRMMAAVGADDNRPVKSFQVIVELCVAPEYFMGEDDIHIVTDQQYKPEPYKVMPAEEKRFFVKPLESLTKENFFNEMQEKYPKSMGLFCKWIDDYKKAVDWDKVFPNPYKDPRIKNPLKYHHLPYAMQQGIWIEFVGQNLHKFFEQPEYSYSGDLEEDIKTVFSEIVPLIDADE